ncbi:MAG: hypothetical protein ACRD0Q_08200, partial [Acidimicrobiales bacterium]
QGGGIMHLEAGSFTPKKSNTGWHTHREHILVAVVLLTAFLVIAPVSVSDAEPELTPIPGLDRWKSQMLRFGQNLCDYLAEPHTSDELLGSVYYDAQRVFYQIADYTGNSAWITCAQRAGAIYRAYVLANNGGVPGYWNFTTGLTMDYLRTGDVTSKNAVILLSQNAAFARENTPLDWTKDAKLSREVAYAIMSYLNAEKVGASPRARLPQLVNQALGHVDQWFRSSTSSYVQPFMVGLTLEALITHYDKAQDPRIPPAVKTALDWLWANAWIPRNKAFWYESTDRTSGAPDLNLLIAPAYAWVYQQTGDATYRDQGDEVFAGGVKGAHLAGGKHFNQNYRWSFDYVKWRTSSSNSSQKKRVQGPFQNHGR